MLKMNELSSPTSCLNKAAPDEPVFVLRAKDLLAAQTVRLWAAMAFEKHEPEKLKEALDLADQMDKWRSQNIAEVAPSVQKVRTTNALPGYDHTGERVR